MNRYDLIAIGGGTAGLVTVVGAAAFGLKTALVERAALGGECLWTGCVPSKALIASAKLAHQMRNAERLGLVGLPPARVFRAVMERMRSAQGTVAHHDDPERFRKMGIDVIFGRAELRSEHRVGVDDRILETKRILIATGSSATVPPIPGLAESGYLTHATAFDETTLPRRIAVLGAGPIGLEFAQLYHRLGAEVTVLEALPRVLPREDEEASKVIAKLLACEGITLHVSTRVERVETGPDGVHRMVATVEGEPPLSLEVDQIFVATGRRANGENLGLEQLGVAVQQGAVGVDATLRTAVPSVWAAGDVSGGLQFTHVADYQAKLVVRNIISPLRAKARYTQVPWVTYTDPEIARVGLTEAEARDRFGRVSVYRHAFADLDRAIVDGRGEGFVKLVTGRKNRIIGATIVGSGAGELLPPIVLAMRHRIPMHKLSQVVWAYPTMAEGLKRTADSYYRDALSGRKGDLVRKVVRWLT